MLSIAGLFIGGSGVVLKNKDESTEAKLNACSYTIRRMSDNNNYKVLTNGRNLIEQELSSS